MPPKEHYQSTIPQISRRKFMGLSAMSSAAVALWGLSIPLREHSPQVRPFPDMHWWTDSIAHIRGDMPALIEPGAGHRDFLIAHLDLPVIQDAVAASAVDYYRGPTRRLGDLYHAIYGHSRQALCRSTRQQTVPHIHALYTTAVTSMLTLGPYLPKEYLAPLGITITAQDPRLVGVDFSREYQTKSPRLPQSRFSPDQTAFSLIHEDLNTDGATHAVHMTGLGTIYQLGVDHRVHDLTRVPRAMPVGARITSIAKGQTYQRSIVDVLGLGNEMHETLTATRNMLQDPGTPLNLAHFGLFAHDVDDDYHANRVGGAVAEAFTDRSDLIAGYWRGIEILNKHSYAAP